MILVDTDVVIDLLRNLPQATEWFASIEDEVIILPGYVAMELVQGCRSRAELGIVEQQIQGMMVVWPDPETCNSALAVYAKRRFSHGLGLLDALVGQLAVSLDLPLHTFNQKHYSGIDGLVTVEPYGR